LNMMSFPLLVAKQWAHDADPPLAETMLSCQANRAS
jgi:hypothetical protein